MLSRRSSLIVSPQGGPKLFPSPAPAAPTPAALHRAGRGTAWLLPRTNTRGERAPATTGTQDPASPRPPPRFGRAEGYPHPGIGAPLPAPLPGPPPQGTARGRPARRLPQPPAGVGAALAPAPRGDPAPLPSAPQRARTPQGALIASGGLALLRGPRSPQHRREPGPWCAAGGPGPALPRSPQPPGPVPSPRH